MKKIYTHTKERYTAYYRKNKEKILADPKTKNRKRRWYLDNKEKTLQRSKRQREKPVATIECAVCGRAKPLKARGCCIKCYGRFYTPNNPINRIDGGMEQAARGDVMCDICGLAPGNCVDHDHTTNRARGRLCYQCNLGLGNFRDNPARLREAAEYLDRLRCF